MFDIMALAFQTDTTRICTFMFANEGTQPPLSRPSASPKATTTSRTTAATRRSTRRSGRSTASTSSSSPTCWASSRRSAKATRSLLDNSMIVYGSGISDGDRHNHDDLPILLAGKGGGTSRPAGTSRSHPQPLE